MNMRPVYFRLTEKEYRKMKVFAALNGITIQALMRSSLIRFMNEFKECQDGKEQKDL